VGKQQRDDDFQLVETAIPEDEDEIVSIIADE
jgi:hypothetical protein